MTKTVKTYFDLELLLLLLTANSRCNAISFRYSNFELSKFGILDGEHSLNSDVYMVRLTSKRKQGEQINSYPTETLQERGRVDSDVTLSRYMSLCELRRQRKLRTLKRERECDDRIKRNV